MVIAPDQFRDEEYSHPKHLLESRGHEVITASVAPGPCRGKLGMMAQATRAMRDLTAQELDGVAFIGGAGASVYFDDPDAHALATALHDSGGVVAAICIAPSTLARAGLLRGRNATCFPSQESDIVAHGATYTAAPVETDGRIVTASGPEAAYDFGNRIADLLECPDAD